MRESHKELVEKQGLNSEHFDAVAENLMITLKDMGVADDLLIGIKLGLLLLTLGLAIHARLFIIPKLTKDTLNSLAYHIVGITTLAVLFVILGAGIRLGGL
jgi:hypothetical protein